VTPKDIHVVVPHISTCMSVCVGDLLQYCVAAWCTVLQRVAVCCSVLQRGEVSVLPSLYVSVSFSVSHLQAYNTNTPLQNTATHCNTRQHTATHGNTLQHTATHCNIVSRYRAATCDMFFHSFDVTDFLCLSGG